MSGESTVTIFELLVPRSARKQASARPRRRIRKLRLFGLLLILVLVLGSMSFTFGLVTSVASEIPSLDPTRLQQREVDGYIYDRKGKRVLAVLRGKQSRDPRAARTRSRRMKLAIVAIEDKRFYEHRGVDVHGIMRAVWQDVRHKAAWSRAARRSRSSSSRTRTRRTSARSAAS